MLMAPLMITISCTTYYFETLQKTHDLICQTKAIARVFKAMSQEKKYIVEEMGFGALEQVPEMNISHSLLRELIACYDDYYGCLNTLHGKIYITPDKVAAARGINNRKCFLLLTMVSMASPIHKTSALRVDNIRQWDWANHVLSFLREGIENRRKGKKQSVNGCVFVLMLIYFHESKFPRFDAPGALGPPWVAHWTRKMMLDQISHEATNTMGLLYRAQSREEKKKRREGGEETSFSEGERKGEAEEKRKENCSPGFFFRRRQYFRF
ncbi:hypothetical protein AHAS_Ahas03G0220400 [Arachis hypogaea]